MIHCCPAETRREKYSDFFQSVNVAMDSISATLRKVLMGFSHDNFQMFKRSLRDQHEIPWLKLEAADIDTTIDLIVQKYTKDDAGQKVLQILKNLKLNQMAKELEKELHGENSESFSTAISLTVTQTTEGREKHADLRILLLGYRGSGKSSSGNTILGKQEFDTSVRTSPCVKRQGEKAGRRITLVEPPGWWRNKTLTSILEFDRRELILSLSLCAPGPHAVLLVIDINRSFIEQYRQSIQEHLKLFGDGIWRYIIILFTHGDWVENSTIEQYIESEGAPLQWLVKKCNKRYHVFNNVNQQNDSQVEILLKKIELMVSGRTDDCFEFNRGVLHELEEKKEEDDRRAEGRRMRVQTQRENLRPPEGVVPHIPGLKIVLVGYREGGKSTVGNLVLGRQAFVPAKRTACCVKREGIVAGRKVTLVEAPGWWKGFSLSDTPERDKREIVLSVSLCPPGPHALLLVVDVTDPLVEKYKNAVQQHLELLGETVWSHTMVVFTRGGWLGHTSIEQYIDSDKQHLQWLVEKCGNRYHVLCKYKKDNCQVTELFKKIEEMVAGNSGRHFHFDSTILQELEEKKKEDEKKADERKMTVQKQRETLRSLAGGLQSVSDFRIVLLGYRGSGKGSSGNTILGIQEFIPSLRTFPCVKKQGRTAGRNITLVEAVGWVVYHSVENTPARDRQELIRSISLCPPGPHAFLLVLSVSLTFREDHRAAVQEHLELLGEGVWSHTMVLFTRGDWLGDTTLEQHIESGGEALKWVVEKCGNRYHILNNLNRQDRAQVSELLQKVQEMVAGNQNIPFMVKNSTE